MSVLKQKLDKVSLPPCRQLSSSRPTTSDKPSISTRTA